MKWQPTVSSSLDLCSRRFLSAFRDPVRVELTDGACVGSTTGGAKAPTAVQEVGEWRRTAVVSAAAPLAHTANADAATREAS